ncbi:hypothetical protein [Pluralibacter sp.]|uniref:hypothetical protein n=1 Tax=Pluralibacter sp. TaxID=1920032 RepID=UPI0025F9A139|nr:hypothetical protein [Pluralibacter sp.]MBV8041916.1 hypothetical protein [Pluralibacter sp.]
MVATLQHPAWSSYCASLLSPRLTRSASSSGVLRQVWPSAPDRTARYHGFSPGGIP